MNKKGTKKLSGALAATTVLTSVAGATPAFAKGTDWDAIYKTAYEAMVKAEKEKTQESINAARKAIGDLAKNKQLFTMASTFSEKVDAVQQGLFNDLYALMYVDGKPKKSMTQEEINKAKALVISFATYEGNKAYIASWSSAIDQYQNAHIVAANTALSKAQKTKEEKDIQEARKLVNVLAQANDETIKKEASRLDVELVKLEAPKAVQKLEAIKVDDLKLADESDVQAQIDAAKKTVNKLSDDKEKKLLNDRIDAKEASINAKLKELKEAQQALKVASVKAINPREIQVTFNQAVDKNTAKDLNNYVFTINNFKYAEDAKYKLSDLIDKDTKNKPQISFSGDEKTLTFKLKENAIKTDKENVNVDVIANAWKYSIDVKDGVLSKDKSKQVEKYVDKQQVFNDTTAPKLEYAYGAGGKLILGFNEPIDKLTAIKVDDVTVYSSEPGKEKGTIAISKDVEDYSLTVNEKLAEKLTTVGKHKVVAYGVKDIAKPVANEAAVVTGEFEIAKDTKAPEVTAVKAVQNDERSFDIYFDETISNVDSKDFKVEVKKGNVTYVNANTVEAAQNKTAKYAVKQIDKDVVRVTFAKDDASSYVNKLYGKNENSVELSVKVEGFKDNAKLVGKEYKQNITLNKDLKAPEIKQNKLDNKINGNTLEVVFNKTIEKVNDEKVIVKDAKGITRKVSSVKLVDGKKVILTLEGFDKVDDLNKKAPFTVVFEAGAVKSLNDVKNEKQEVVINETTVADPAIDGVKVKSVKAAKVEGANANKIQITYPKEMNASAVELNNYTLDGKALPKGTKIEMDKTDKVVTITLPEGYSKVQNKQLLEISKKVTTKDGSVIVKDISSKKEFTELVELVDNTQPRVKEAKYLVDDTKKAVKTNVIAVTFSEDLAKVENTNNFRDDLKVVVNGAEQTIASVVNSKKDSDKLIVTLAKEVNVDQNATISIVKAGTDNKEVNISDLAGNVALADSKATTSGFELNLENSDVKPDVKPDDKPVVKPDDKPADKDFVATAGKYSIILGKIDITVTNVDKVQKVKVNGKEVSSNDISKLDNKTIRVFDLDEKPSQIEVVLKDGKTINVTLK